MADIKKKAETQPVVERANVSTWRKIFSNRFDSMGKMQICKQQDLNLDYNGARTRCLKE